MKKYPYEEAASMLKTMAHPVRISIIALLDKKKCLNVGAIQRLIGLKQSITSQHLKAMAEKGILERKKESNVVYYSIKKKDVLKLLSCVKGCCER